MMALLSRIYLGLLAVAAAVELSIGSSFVVVLTLFLIGSTALISLSQRRLNVPDLIFASMALYNGGFALLMKALLFQRADDNLIAPGESSVVLLIAHFATTIAYILYLNLRLPADKVPGLASTFNSLGFLKFFSKFGFISGYALHLLHFAFRANFVNGAEMKTEGFGGFGTFYFLLVFGFTAQLALCALEPRQRTERWIAGAMFAAIAASAIMGNLKKDIFDAAAAAILIVYAFGISIKPRHYIGAAAFVAVIIFIITPLIHITRGLNSNASIGERIELTLRILDQNNYDLAQINTKSERILKAYTNQYRPYQSYVYPSGLNVDRFALILPVDQVVRVNDPGRVAIGDVIARSADAILPSIIWKKTPGVLADYISWKYGFRTFNTVSRPVVGLAASSFALGGMLAAFCVTFILISILFVFIDRITGAISGSPWAIGFAVILSQIAEKEIDSIVGTIFHDLPIIIIVIWTIMLIWLTANARLPRHVRGLSSLQLR